MSSTKKKCPEMIGYVGDVRNLSHNRGGAVDEKNILAWARRSSSVVCSKSFETSPRVLIALNTRSKLLEINPLLKFKQISTIEEFIDYIDTGMDRNQHPVKDIEMIHVYSAWEVEVDYIEEARKRHEPEVRQISRETLKAFTGEMAKQTVIHVFLGNKEQNQTKSLTDKEQRSNVCPYKQSCTR